MVAPMLHTTLRAASARAVRRMPTALPAFARGLATAGEKSENPTFSATTVEDLQGVAAATLLAETGTKRDSQLRHFTVNFGPQHPAAHGVLRLILELNGEEILRVDVRTCLPAPRRPASPWYREADRVQDLHAGSAVLRPSRLQFYDGQRAVLLARC